MNRLVIALLLVSNLAFAGKLSELLKDKIMNSEHLMFGEQTENVIARLQAYHLCGNNAGIEIDLNRDDELELANIERDRENDSVRAELRSPLMLGMSFAAFYKGLKSSGVKITTIDIIGFRTEDGSEWVGWGYEFLGHKSTPMQQLREASASEVAKALNVLFVE